MRVAAGIVPRAVPAILGEDRASRLLRDGLARAREPPGVEDAAARRRRSRPRSPRRSATRWGASTRRPPTAPTSPRAFATDDIFFAIRLEPYLVATAGAHPDLATRLAALVETTRRTRRVLVHGDFSPKNILRGPDGPVILDAECAWYGDPAFDLAFVLNHLLLKGLWRPAWRGRYLDAFAALADAYLAHVAWEPRAALDARTAALLPGLLLGRVDGKSPVEYLTDADRRAPRCAPSPARCCCSRSTISPSIGRAAGAKAATSMNTTHRPRSTPAGSGIRAGGRPSRPRSRSPAARSDVPSRRRGPRAARARPSTCATAAARWAAWTCSAPSPTSTARSPRRSRGRDAARPGRRRRAAGGAGRHAEQGDAGRQRDDRGVARGRARRRGRPRTAAVATPRRRRAGLAAAARDPDLRRRRARRSPDRHPGPDGDARRRGELRRGDA